MKSISVALRNHLRSRSTTLCFCWKLTRLDGAIYGFTTASRDVDFAGVTYLAQTGFLRSAIAAGSDLAVSNQEVQGVIDSDVLTEADLLTGLWDHAEVEIFIINYLDTTMGIMRLPGGRIGEIRQSRIRFHAEIRGFAQQLQQTIGRLYQPACRADVFDTRCGLDAALFTVDAVVTSSTDRRTFTAASLGQAPGYFDEGLVTWQSGCDNTGRAMEVKTFTSGNEILLVEAMPFAIVPGDSFAIRPGCGKRFQEDCIAKFSNGLRFDGEPWLPGLDRIMRGLKP